MSTQRALLTGLLILALLASGAAASPAQPVTWPAAPALANALTAPGDEYWAAGFNPPGMNLWVSTMVVGTEGSLYAGGTFANAGGVRASLIARWDGAQWHPLDSGMEGTDYAEVYALAVGPEGSLYAGGIFTTAGGVAANNIARWNAATSSWHPLGSGMDDEVYALAFGPDGSLYAGGDFTTAGGVVANGIARWDGAQWHPLGIGMYGFVSALAVGPDGSLYAGGWFNTAGGVAANHIARWDGIQWHTLGSGMSGGYNPHVSALAVGLDGSLYAGGAFTTAGGVGTNNIARWDGFQWHPLGSGVGGGGGYPFYETFVRALTVGPDGTLYAGGRFTMADGVAANHIARWDGTTSSWHPLSSGMSGAYAPYVYALTIGPDSSLYAGGNFTTAGGVAVNYIARWDEATSSWRHLGSSNGMNSFVFALAVGLDGSLYAGGDFTTAGGTMANRIARWDGVQWHPLGSGMGGYGPWIHALTVGPDGSLYAGGGFTTAGGTAVNRIARWDAATLSWHPLGVGMYGYVSALTVGPDGSLYAGGDFTAAGGTTANRIARWDGVQWHPLGSGTDGHDPSIRALTVGPDGSLYAGGIFATAGGVAANNIARWDGVQWHPLGSGVTGGVSALALGPDGTLYAGGEFTAAGGAAANYIARWDGSQWHPLGSGMGAEYFTPSVFALAVGPDGSLYAGGDFTTAGGVAAHNIARWDGAQWNTLGSGLKWGELHALTAGQDGSIYAGGVFTKAGGKPSSYIAQWTGSATPVHRYLPLILKQGGTTCLTHPQSHLAHNGRAAGSRRCA